MPVVAPLLLDADLLVLLLPWKTALLTDRLLEPTPLIVARAALPLTRVLVLDVSLPTGDRGSSEIGDPARTPPPRVSGLRLPSPLEI